jgi:photosystem II stability/assembly factor-like uncharacterized protein
MVTRSILALLACAPAILLASHLRAGSSPATTRAATKPALTPEMPHYGAWLSSRIGLAHVLDVVVSRRDPQRCYAYTDFGGPYRSVDGGVTWRSLQGRLPARRGNYAVRTLLLDPRDEKHLLVALGHPWAEPEGVYLSSDAGETWKRVLHAPFQAHPFGAAAPVLARHPTRPDIVLAATIDAGVFRSADNGRTWQEVGLPHLFPTQVRFDAAHPDRIFLCAAKYEGRVNGKSRQFTAGFFASRDAGETWEHVADESPRFTSQDPLHPRRLYGTFEGKTVVASDDGGRSWVEWSKELRFDASHVITSLTSGPDFTVVTTRGGGGGSYRLAASGEAWERLAAVSGHVDTAFSVTVSPHDARHWYASTDAGVWQTSDGGATWRRTSHGIEGALVLQLLQDPSDPAVVHLGTFRHGYFRSTDGGRSFGPASFPNACPHVKDLALPPVLPSRVYAVGSDGEAEVSNRLYVSIDAGATWHRSPMIGLPDMDRHRCNSVAVDPDDPYRVFIGVSGDVRPSEGGPYVSADGGRTFNWIGHGLPEGEPFYADSAWAAGREIAAGRDGRLLTIGHGRRAAYAFDARGSKWSRLDVPADTSPRSIAADRHRAGAFYLAAGEAGLLRTHDGGGTWRRVYDRYVSHVAADLAVAGRAAAGTSDGVILTRDGGETWSMLDKSLPDRAGLNPPAFAGQRIVVGSAGAGAFWMALSRDGERAVSPKKSTTRPTQIFLDQR